MSELQLLKDAVINKLSKENLYERYLYHKSITYTRQDVINEIKNNTEIGNIFIKDLIILSLDLFERNKENLNNFKK